jgi:fructose-bisphosphate aldolase class 1
MDLPVNGERPRWQPEESASRRSASVAAMQSFETPWPLTFSFGRALVDAALVAWRGNPLDLARVRARWPASSRQTRPP